MTLSTLTSGKKIKYPSNIKLTDCSVTSLLQISIGQTAYVRSSLPGSYSPLCKRVAAPPRGRWLHLRGKRCTTFSLFWQQSAVPHWLLVPPTTHGPCPIIPPPLPSPPTKVSEFYSEQGSMVSLHNCLRIQLIVNYLRFQFCFLHMACAAYDVTKGSIHVMTWKNIFDRNLFDKIIGNRRNI